MKHFRRTRPDTVTPPSRSISQEPVAAASELPALELPVGPPIGGAVDVGALEQWAEQTAVNDVDAGMYDQYAGMHGGALLAEQRIASLIDHLRSEARIRQHDTRLHLEHQLRHVDHRTAASQISGDRLGERLQELRERHAHHVAVLDGRAVGEDGGDWNDARASEVASLPTARAVRAHQRRRTRNHLAALIALAGLDYLATYLSLALLGDRSRMVAGLSLAVALGVTALPEIIGHAAKTWRRTGHQLPLVVGGTAVYLVVIVGLAYLRVAWTDHQAAQSSNSATVTTAVSTAAHAVPAAAATPVPVLPDDVLLPIWTAVLLSVGVVVFFLSFRRTNPHLTQLVAVRHELLTAQEELDEQGAADAQLQARAALVTATTATVNDQWQIWIDQALPQIGDRLRASYRSALARCLRDPNGTTALEILPGAAWTSEDGR